MWAPDVLVSLSLQGWTQGDKRWKSRHFHILAPKLLLGTCLASLLEESFQCIISQVWIPSCLGHVRAIRTAAFRGAAIQIACSCPETGVLGYKAGLLTCPSLLASTAPAFQENLKNRSRTGSRTSKLKGTSEDVHSGSSQFIFNLKTLSSKGRLMQRYSLSIDES